MEVLRYLSISIIFYVAILISLFLLIDVFNAEKILAYVFVYSISYTLEYIITLVFVFGKKQSWTKVIKFLLYISFFLLVSTASYKYLINVGVYHLFSAILVAVIFMPFRFLMNKYWVYR